nr:MAG TPA: hypothetical protein [Caudoviricetes sp.]
MPEEEHNSNSQLVVKTIHTERYSAEMERNCKTVQLGNRALKNSHEVHYFPCFCLVL